MLGPFGACAAWRLMTSALMCARTERRRTDGQVVPTLVEDGGTATLVDEVDGLVVVSDIARAIANDEEGIAALVDKVDIWPGALYPIFWLTNSSISRRA